MTDFVNYGVREEERKKNLDAMSIHDLRKIGRRVGVKSPSNQNKADLIRFILDVEYGRTAPTTSRRGRHPKSAQSLTPNETAEAADGKRPSVSRTVRGLVTLLPGGDATLSADWLPQTTGPVSFAPAENVQIPAGVALESALRSGDVVVGVARTDESGTVALHSVGSINGKTLEEAKNRVRIQSAFGGYPSKQFDLSAGAPILRAAQLFAPLGRGARAVAVTPSQTETENLLRKVLKEVSAQTPYVFVLFNEEYPEDAAEFCEGLPVTPILLEYGKPALARENSIRTVFEHCKRLAEGGDDAVLVIPSLTKLALTTTEANALSTLCPASFTLAKEIFGSASTLTGGGSFTVLMGAVLSPADDVASAAYNALASAANAHLALHRQNGILRVDVQKSYTKRAEKLLCEEEVALAQTLRERAENGNCDFLDDLANAETYYQAITTLKGRG